MFNKFDIGARSGSRQSEELANFDRRNSPTGRLERYLIGRWKALHIRSIVHLCVAFGLGYFVDPKVAVTVFCILFIADVFESGMLYAAFKAGRKFWITDQCKWLVLATSIVSTLGVCFAISVVWVGDGHSNRLLASTMLMACSVNAGFFVHLYRPVNYAKQFTFGGSLFALFAYDYSRSIPQRDPIYFSDLLAGIVMVVCLILCYMRLAQFAEARFASERTLLTSKLEAERVTETMHFRARHDSLTGLPNRAYLAEFMAKMMENARKSGSQFAIFHIDLDKFKEVNDTAGHAAGDCVLETTADALRSSVRQGDFVARIGGDEFVVVSQSDVSLEELISIADRIIKTISKPIMFMDQELRVGASVGFALSQTYHLTGEAVLLDADLALYEAKNDGRGVAKVFKPSMRAEFEERTRIVADLITGLENGEIETVFQPQVDLHSHLVTGFEALVRWRHPSLGLLMPSRFVKLAEEAGMLKEITLQVAEQSFEALQIWRNAGYEVPCIGLNFASRELEDRATIDRIKWMVENAGLLPEDVTIEVLESVLSSTNSDALISNIKALSAAGFSIDLDDFGTEHASIANMRSFAVQRIKIDKGFVQDIENLPDQQRLVSAMVQLARSLGVQVLAEGVETGAEIDILSSLGCDQVQGYFFARPMGLEASLEWLANCGLVKRRHIQIEERAALF